MYFHKQALNGLVNMTLYFTELIGATNGWMHTKSCFAVSIPREIKHTRRDWGLPAQYPVNT